MTRARSWSRTERAELWTKTRRTPSRDEVARRSTLERRLRDRRPTCCARRAGDWRGACAACEAQPVRRVKGDWIYKVVNTGKEIFAVAAPIGGAVGAVALVSRSVYCSNHDCSP
jgi:hypothetical protein